ncbi:3-hydroxyacyl-CoA dehydrogenase family protein [uncultured Pseudokineococcus sp.]|uniref:3-hydroxyacyl-CoA dehydrogenase family protein n=1 Tax=uncultured Pseudokineococcus sp. TaxID=1642928 RepID=UPI00261C38E5|nr:3-hydroxyacyl-CoA dehydrogenase family protein [uncultured Pseudokineococcus sp.]
MAVRRIESAAVVGTGYMGGGIAQSLAIAGVPVQLADADAETTRTNHERLLREARVFEQNGLYPAGAADAVEANLHPRESLEDAVADVDWVEEAVPEIPDLKLDVLRQVDAAARADAIIGTNTSTIPVEVLSAAIGDKSRFLTVHFSNPAPFIPGVELVSGEHTDPAVVEAVEELLARMGRRSAQVADVPGFVLNRLQFVLLKEAMAVVEEGVATPQDVDTVVSTTFGFRLPFFGPFAIADMAGLDTYVRGFGTLQEGFGDRLSAPKLLTDVVDAGRHGTKNGGGFYDLGPEQLDELIAYRDRAYHRMQQLLDELGPSPIQQAGMAQLPQRDGEPPRPDGDVPDASGQTG